MQTARRTVALVLTSLVFTLAACGGDDDDAATDTTADEATTTTAASDETTTSDTTDTTAAEEEAAPQGTATAEATGVFAFAVSGPGGSCAYYFPGDQTGVSYAVSSRDFPDYTGMGWNIAVQGDSADDAGVLLTTEETSYANNGDAGNLHVDPDLHHADFDIDLVNIVNHNEVVHLTGTIDCP